MLSFSEITRYEVVRGLLAVRASSRLTMFAQVCDTCEVIPVDWSVLERAATIWADLRRQGRMIEETDILIAASALCRNCAIVSHNTRHFQPVSGPTVIDWTLQGT
ncbi:MAG: PIN domain-containing protein [Vitreimonas sp.]